MLLCEQPGRTGVYATATSERISLYSLSAASPLSRAASPTAPGGPAAHGVHTSAPRWGPPLSPSCTVPFPSLGEGKPSALRVPVSLSLSCAVDEAVRFFVSDAAGGAWIGAADGSAQALHAGAAGALDAAYGGRGAVAASGWDPRNAAVLALGRCDGSVQLLDVEAGGPGHARQGAKSAVAQVVQERALQGTVTDLDWVPLSHMMVVAARLPGDAGYYAELMDMRSPESGIRYPSAPQAHAAGAVSSRTALGTGQSGRSGAHTSAGGGAFALAPCYAERVACDVSQTYVAVAGNRDRSGIVQLWDLRLTSRPVQSHVCPRTEYTSLRWSPCEPLTVVATTRNGRLRLHSFTCPEVNVHDEDGSDEGSSEDDKDERQSGGAGFHSLETEDSATYLRSMAVSRSYTNGGSWLHARVPAAGVAWWTDNSAGALQNNTNKAPFVAMGRRTDMPCLLLLNAKTGLLHPQVFSRTGSTVAMAGEVALCGAGPNVFLLPHVMEPHRHTNVSMNSKTNPNTGPAALSGSRAVGVSSNMIVMDNTSSGDDLTAANASLFRVGAERTSLSSGRLPATEYLTHAEASQPTIHSLDRTMYRRERLRQGFLPQLLKPLLVLTREGFDSEACALFRYGWLLQRQLHPSRQTMPVTDIVPGLIELLQREQPSPKEKKSQTPQDPQHPLFCVRMLILRAMGWCADPNDDPLPSSTSPASLLRTSIDDPLDVFPASPTTEAETPDTSVPPPLQQLELMDLVGAASQQEAVERRAAILTCLGRLRDAAAMLVRHRTLHSVYSTVALQLSLLANLSASPGNASQGRLFESVLASSLGTGCTRWMDLCLFLAEPIALAAEGRRAAQTPLSSRRELFAHTMNHFQRFLPIADQIALAAALLLSPAGTASSGEEREALTGVLREMVQQRFCANGSGASLLLAAAVEGIDRECISLQRYIDETGDLQTPICYVTLYGPAGRSVWRGWNDAYRGQLNAEGNAILRSMHDLSNIKMIRLRESENSPSGGICGSALRQPHDWFGVPYGGLAQGEPIKTKPSNRDGGRLSVELHCGCGQPMHTRAAAIAGKTRDARCRQMTRCGNPDCRLGQTPMCVVCSESLDKRSGDGAVDTYFAWCTVCLHGGHWAHLRDWLEKHRSCPVEDCPCLCVYDKDV